MTHHFGNEVGAKMWLKLFTSDGFSRLSFCVSQFELVKSYAGILRTICVKEGQMPIPFSKALDCDALLFGKHSKFKFKVIL